MLNPNKIILGTAQFDGIYGISNNKKLSDKAVEKIIIHSLNKGIKQLEICSSYGKSQDKIVYILKKKNLSKKIEIIYKFDKITKSELSYLHLFKNEFKLSSIFAHSSNFFLSKKFQELIDRFKNEKIKVGVSIYEKKELEKILKEKKIPDFIQIPFNIFNKTFDDNNLEKKLKKKKIKIHLRSIFNQGLIFLNNKFLKKKFPSEFKNLYLIKKEIKNYKENIFSLSVNYVFQKLKFEKILIGVVNYNQINEILNLNIKKIDKNLLYFLDNYKFKSEAIKDPRKWKKK